MEETKEEIEERGKLYDKYIKEFEKQNTYDIPYELLFGNQWYFTAKWYAEKYPGYPDFYYEIFEDFSNNYKPNKVIEDLLQSLTLD